MQENAFKLCAKKYKTLHDIIVCWNDVVQVSEDELENISNEITVPVRVAY